MNLVSRPTLFSAAVELLPHIVTGPLGGLNEDEELQAVQRAARLARLLAKEFSEGAWAPTIAPLPRHDVELQATGQEKNPEWIRLPTKGKCPYTGLSRGAIYNLVGASKVNGYKPPVKSIVLRHRGAARGVRLISYDSLMDYLASEKSRQCPN